jgi:hypothetical protein
MGFRGSRVQISPSRLVQVKAQHRSGCWAFPCAGARVVYDRECPTQHDFQVALHRLLEREGALDAYEVLRRLAQAGEPIGRERLDAELGDLRR